jgi:hypothetical protein
VQSPHLESYISDDLVDYLASLTKNERDRIDSLEDLEEWLHEMMAGSRKHHLALVEEAVKRQRTSFTSHRSHASKLFFHYNLNYLQSPNHALLYFHRCKIY